ncbi:M24 family metallopeptidase [Gimibacter soli]|uniref:Xaa-Pro peptidase family protein n=1 Tax=Gimibacter soli TaxID=3024400 RepID=A0AAF0BMQ9_9PROT|nr:Xaa-Pro peptidase family protein [Gimibacter soli]WCL54826.1 Xaa-Pro peptidase family protein [Gimibacter soli]
MKATRRDLFKLGAGLAALPLVSRASFAAGADAPTLASLTGGVQPITVEERKARIKRAQELMEVAGIDALVIEPGAAMLYFSGIRWWRSERLTALVIPAKGEIGVVTPFFEEPSVRQSLTFGDDVRPWHEHENPFKRVAQILADRGLTTGRIGLEGTVRYFVADGLKKAASGFEIVSGEAVTRGCRMIKSPAEIALLHKANEITLAAYRHVWPQVKAGMTPADIGAMMHQAQKALGGSDTWALVLVGEASAYPHGSEAPQVVKDGEIVLMDCGCAVEGYQSDISRTFVFGTPTSDQREVYARVRKGQDVAFKAAQLGAPAGSIDDAVRAYYESLGYGPGYKTPGLSHRTGHGIGMEGHESPNFVHSEAMPLAPGMCFSNEPGIYSFGKFGVRLEDCLHMTADGPVWFTVPPESLDEPFGALGPI